jgi:uncharacterized protein with HEPN domain
VSDKDIGIYAEAALDMIKRIRTARPASIEAVQATADAWDAACMRVQVLGEQVIQIDSTFEKTRNIKRWLSTKYPEHAALLASLVGTRNVISHNYVHIEPNYVWELYSTHLDTIEDLFRRVLRDYQSW